MPDTTDVKAVWTEQQYKAAEAALFAQQGACNGAGVANSLVEAYRAWLHTEGTEAANESAPVRLMLHQMAHLAGCELEVRGYGLYWYDVATKKCEQIIKEYEEANPK